MPVIIDTASLKSDGSRDPYRGVLLALVLGAGVGAIGSAIGASMLDSSILFDLAVALGLSAGILAGVAWARHLPALSPTIHTPSVDQAPATQELVERSEPPALAQSDQTTEPDAADRPQVAPARVLVRLFDLPDRFRDWFRALSPVGRFQFVTGAAGLLAIAYEWLRDFQGYPPLAFEAASAALLCLGGAGLAATAVHYLSTTDPATLPEAPALIRGGRIVTWLLIVVAASMGLAWLEQQTAIRVLHAMFIAINATVCYSLVAESIRIGQSPRTFPLEWGMLSTLGSRPNILASILDSAERQLGIDLRSTWALTVLRQSIEPLVIGVALLGWLSTSVTVVGLDEEALVERLGVPVGGDPLQPGLHLHWPWPVDRTYRIPVRRVQTLTVGHEGEEKGGPEDVLWARQHAANEYTLLLGNGRDLITVDAAVQFRIVDVRAWQYHSQNPADALRAIAYRAVMRNTVNRTLAEALSENVVTTTARMRTMVQHDADALELGVEVLGFTVGGMHPPVQVADAYQAVVSAELAKVTALVDAQAARNQSVPYAESTALAGENAARAQGVRDRAQATGEAWSFIALLSQYRSAPQDYTFRRRLEVLEQYLSGRRFTVIDSRFQRDGGELWLMP